MKKLIISLSLITSSFLFANSNIVLSENKNELLKLTEEQIESNKFVDKFSWISPLNTSYSSVKNSLSNDSVDQFTISINQEIYKFGNGISKTMNLAETTANINKLATYKERISYIKDIYLNKLNYEQTKLLVSQNKLRIKNSQIDLKIKKDKYQLGEIDISSLNLSLIEEVSLKQSLLNYQTLLETYSNNVSKNSDKKIEDITLIEPYLLTKNEFIDNQISLKELELNIEKTSLNKDILLSDNLPAISFVSNYNNIDSGTGFEDNYNVGFNISMPLKFTFLKTLETAKIELLKQKRSKNELLNSLEVEYNEYLNNIKKYNGLILLATENTNTYQELVDFTKRQFEVGYKTKLDLESLENTLEIQNLEIKIQLLNILKERINIYLSTKTI